MMLSSCDGWVVSLFSTCWLFFTSFVVRASFNWVAGGCFVLSSLLSFFFFFLLLFTCFHPSLFGDCSSVRCCFETVSDLWDSVSVSVGRFCSLVVFCICFSGCCCCCGGDVSIAVSTVLVSASIAAVSVSFLLVPRFDHIMAYSAPSKVMTSGCSLSGFAHKIQPPIFTSVLGAVLAMTSITSTPSDSTVEARRAGVAAIGKFGMKHRFRGGGRGLGDLGQYRLPSTVTPWYLMYSTISSVFRMMVYLWLDLTLVSFCTPTRQSFASIWNFTAMHVITVVVSTF